VIAKQLVRYASILTTALLAVMLLGVAGTLAKTPAWSMTVVPIPTQVGPGSYAAFQVTIANNGSSNIAKLFLTDSSGATPFSVSPSTGCNTSGQLNCSLGALNSHRSVTRTIVYKTNAAASSFDITFEANTSGVSFSDHNTSHGDTLRGSASTPENGSGDFAGGYVVDNSNFSTGGGDNQQTTVNPPSTGIGVTITETGGSSNPCGAGTPIGQLSTINVGNGAAFSPFLMTLTVKTTSLPAELQLGQVKLCHQYDNGSHADLPKCAADAAQATPCFWPKWGGAHHPDREEHPGEVDADDWTLLILDVWDVQNGSLRGHF
jgi:hypothetical protein